MNILDKIKKANLVGRGGACFPTALKWEMVKNATGDNKYVVCNAAEGELGVLKDDYILKHHPERLIDGIVMALEFLSSNKAIVYINKKYYKRYGKRLKKIIGNKPIELFVKPSNAGYIGGEESALLNAIEGRKIEPRLKPPFPTVHGLYGQPTLIDNVETFYNVSLVNSGEYEHKRFYTINGDCLWTGVYDLPENLTIEKVLKTTKNYPDFPFFVQVGGDASGIVLNNKQLKIPVSGAASITVYSLTKYSPEELIKKWISFFRYESCGQCTPCREGAYRLREIINSKHPNWNLVADLLDNLDDTSFCGLGCVVSTPIRSYINNVLLKLPANKIQSIGLNKKVVCECFVD